MKLKNKYQFETILKNFIKSRVLIFFVLTLAVLSFQNCAPSSSPKTGDAKQEELSSLERKIALQNEALLNLTKVNLTCTRHSDCATVEVGRRACGGPRGYYVISKNNDLVQIQTLSIDLVNLEEEYLTKMDAISTCEVIVPPSVSCVANICK